MKGTNPSSGRRLAPPGAALLLVACCGSALGAPQDIPLTCVTSEPIPYAVKPDTAVAPPATINVTGASGDVRWSFTSVGGACSVVTTSTLNCIGLNVKLPGSGAVHPDLPVTIDGTSQSSFPAESSFTLHVESATDPSQFCERIYQPHLTASGGGWGDPHLTTVNKVNYDFQSVGEFVALRGNGIEIQTRQAAVPGAAPPADGYTGLKVCPAVYTAVAARVGKHRVTFQQSAGNAAVMELRVDGALKSLAEGEINLESLETLGAPGPVLKQRPNVAIAKPEVAEKLRPDARVIRPRITHTEKVGGRIKKPAQGEGIEIDYVDGTRLVVTQNWWDGQKTWYLTINVYDTSSSEGTIGAVPKGSWLPALSNGQSVGAMPATLHDRYTTLYKTFADSWRVTDGTSLFDYAAGTSTRTFTNSSLPAENPGDCSVNGKAVAAVAPAVAEQQCSGITDPTLHANCVYDVMATGFTGFSAGYLVKQKLDMRGPRVSIDEVIDRGRPGELSRIVATIDRGAAVTRPAGTVQFYVDGKKYGGPVTLDAGGKATLDASKLPAGAHHVTAQYVQSGFGTDGAFVSNSRVITHDVKPMRPVIK